MRSFLHIVLLFFLLFFSSKLQAKKWYVNDGSLQADVYCSVVGSDANSGDLPAKPFLTLSKALLAVSDNDTIYVDAGTYTNASTVVKKNNLKIIGAGKAWTIFTSNTISTSPLFDGLGSIISAAYK